MKEQTILDRILARKRQEVAERKQALSSSQLADRCVGQSPCRGFAAALRARIEAGQSAVIAEVKKASPSRGVIRADFDPVAIAASYERGGAACLSVLTDIDFFQGSDEFLVAARSATSIPVLRKDFVVDKYQLVEARALGADCILLIAAAFEPGSSELQDLADEARSLGLDVLLEVHDQAELDRGLDTGVELIGINNRDLRSFVTSLDVTYGLLDAIPNDRLVVTESGIGSTADVQAMREHGVNAFLVGESLMKSPDPGDKLAAMFGL